MPRHDIIIVGGGLAGLGGLGFREVKITGWKPVERHY